MLGLQATVSAVPLFGALSLDVLLNRGSPLVSLWTHVLGMLVPLLSSTRMVCIVLDVLISLVCSSHFLQCMRADYPCFMTFNLIFQVVDWMLRCGCACQHKSLLGSIRSHVSHMLHPHRDASHAGPSSTQDGEQEQHVRSDADADSLDPESSPPVGYDDGPRTAPLTNPRSGFLFDSKPTPIHTPERKREHTRFPSEGVFNLSMDEDSSLYNAAGELNAKADFPPRRRIASAASTPLGLKRDFWASSKFQNSPSPDVLPIPAFKAQVALN